MGITLARAAALAAVLRVFALPSIGYGGTINESYAEFFAQPIDVTNTTVVDGLGYVALWDDDVYRANIGIFTEIDGAPDALITQTGAFDPISGTYDLPVIPTTTLSAGSYWVLGGYNRTGSREDVEEDEGPDYVASLPSSWTFGHDFVYLYEDVVFYTVNEEPASSSDGTVVISHSSNQLTYGLDYLSWASNFGSPSPRTFTPEPATCSLLVVGAMALLMRRRRR